jgi:threonine dehydratase
VDLDRIRRAEAVVRRFFPPTPLLRAGRLSRRLGVELWLKLDAFTPIRTFKLRGALVKLQALTEAGLAGGVITASAGNHGLAVAHAARLFGRPASVVVPERANPQKADAIAAEGARVLRFGVDYQAAYERSLEIAASEGLHHVHAYDDPDVIAGQGTVALELPECGAFLCGIGGGGLIAGTSTALRARFPATAIVGVQPEGADSMARSLEQGRRVTLEEVRTIADGLAARSPGDRTLQLVRRNAVRVVRVSDAQILEAARLLLREERVVAEPAGVAALAALVCDPGLASGRTVVLISGANISDELLAGLLRD